MKKSSPPDVPFNRPFIVGKELYFIAQAVERGHLAGDGLFSQRCNEWLETRCGVRRALLTHSCTAALEMAAILAGVGPGDEVILPSYTFVSTANAFALRGATLRFVDIRSDTLNLDETQIESVVSSNTKVIVPVHYAGVSCEMDEITRIAERHNLIVVEDAAQGVHATYKGRALGSIGALGTLSFHETKNVISGEGGAILVNDERFVERAEIIREKGTNRSKYFRGQVDKYTWVDVGSSYLPSEIVAAFLAAQLEMSETITNRRLAVWREYYEALTPLQDAGRLRLPFVPAECEHNGHMFYILANTSAERNELLESLKELGIQAVFHYVPLHSSPMGVRLQDTVAELPCTDDIASRLVRLPCYFELSPEEQQKVIAAVDRCVGRS